jgi:hypothetical protein
VATAPRRGRPVKIAGGRQATLYLEPHTQGSATGVSADLVTGDSVCFVHGLITPEALRNAIADYTPL